MGERTHLSVRVDESVGDRVDEYGDDMGIETKSEATEEILRLGLESAGYGGPMEKQTRLMWLARVLSIVGFIAGLSWAVAGFGFDIKAAVTWGFAGVAFGVVFWSVYAGLERREPRVSRWLTRKFDPRTDVVAADGGEEA